MPSAPATAAHSSMTVRAKAVAGGEVPRPPSVARVTVVSGLNAAFPISLSQIWGRRSRSIGHFSPPATNASRDRLAARRCARRAGVPIVNRVPSMCRMTPGATISVAQ